jgi:hypothetical protein
VAAEQIKGGWSVNMINNPAQKIQNLRAMHVPNERDEEVKKHLYRLFKVDSEGNRTPEPRRSVGGMETEGVALIEAAGGGKTTAIRVVLEEAPFLAPDPETGCPRVLEIQVPSPATLKSVGLAVLEAMGMDSISVNAREWEIWKVVKHRLGVMGISVLWLDEAHDLIMAQTATETEKTLRMIKSLMQGENAVILILSGTQRLSKIMSFDTQVSRRFTMIVPSDLQHGADEDNLSQMIGAYCDEVGLEARLCDGLTSRLITASRHRFGRAVETIIIAIECALWERAKNLHLDHFAEAWAMQEGCEPQANVFLSEHWRSLQIDKEAYEYEQARTLRHRKKLERA